jgi:transcriptional regulator of met regulon
MSRRETTRIVEVHEIFTKCDFCDTESRANERKLINSCYLCKKDICHKHTHDYTEQPDLSGDYYSSDFDICPDCKPKFQPVWEDALQIAVRHDDIKEVVKKLLKERGIVK